MSTAPISLHLILELSLALYNHDHTVTLVCHWSMYTYVTQGGINWCHRDQDLKSAEPKAKNELRTKKKQKNNQRKWRKVKNHRSFFTKLSKKRHAKNLTFQIFFTNTKVAIAQLQWFMQLTTHKKIQGKSWTHHHRSITSDFETISANSQEQNLQ